MLVVLLQANASVCFNRGETAQTKRPSHFSSFNLKRVKRLLLHQCRRTPHVAAQQLETFNIYSIVIDTLPCSARDQAINQSANTEVKLLQSHWDVATAWRRMLLPRICGWWVRSRCYGSYHAPRQPAHQHLFSWMTDSFRCWVMVTLRRSRACRSGFMDHPPQISAGGNAQHALAAKWSPKPASLCSLKIIQAISRVVESFLWCPCAVTNVAQRTAATVCPLSMRSL